MQKYTRFSTHDIHTYGLVNRDVYKRVLVENNTNETKELKKQQRQQHVN